MTREAFIKKTELAIRKKFQDHGISVEVEIADNGIKEEQETTIVIGGQKYIKYNSYYGSFDGQEGDFVEGEVDRYLQILRSVWR